MENYTPRTADMGRPSGDSQRLTPKSETPDVQGLPGTTATIPSDRKPLSIFKEPYLIELLGLDSLYESNVDDIVPKIKLIDDWIKKKIETPELRSTKLALIPPVESVQENKAIPE